MDAQMEKKTASQAAVEADSIAWIKLSSVFLPLKTPISDAKVLTGRQRPLTEVAFLFAEIETKHGHSGIGFSYSKRAGGPGQYEHAKEIADVLIGEDPNDIGKLWNKLCWAGASVGRSGLAVQAIAAFDVALWDLKAKLAGEPLWRLLGARDRFVSGYASGLDIALDDTTRYTVPGCYTIATDRLAQLDGTALATLNQSGFLRHAFLVASSLSNVGRLIDLKNRRRRAEAGEAVPVTPVAA